jgi:hypothetical protein
MSIRTGLMDLHRMHWAEFKGECEVRPLTVPTAMLNVFCVFFALSLQRRRVLHVNVTSHPLRCLGRVTS